VGNLAVIFLTLSIIFMSIAVYYTMDMVVALEGDKLASVSTLKRTFVLLSTSLLFMLLLVATVYASFVLGVCL
jgi:4-hydroxybenzoate polyprenyltransferase